MWYRVYNCEFECKMVGLSPSIYLFNGGTNGGGEAARKLSIANTPEAKKKEEIWPHMLMELALNRNNLRKSFRVHLYLFYVLEFIWSHELLSRPKPPSSSKDSIVPTIDERYSVKCDVRVAFRGVLYALCFGLWC